MRLFVAIDIEPHVRIRLKQIQNRLDQELNLSGKNAKWIHPDQVHLTLKFLGEVDDSSLTQICDIVTRTASEFEGFDFEVKGLGVFGRPARVVWAGISECPAIMALWARLESEFARHGWPGENRPFAGHLTVCRVKHVSAGRKLAEAVRSYEDESFGRVCAKEVVLYQSQLTSSGPVYSAVCRAALR